MRILFRIGMGVVKPVHNAVRIGTDIGRALRDVTADKKNALPITRHREMVVGRIAVVEERLKKKGGVPVYDKENKNFHTVDESSITIFIIPGEVREKWLRLGCKIGNCVYTGGTKPRQIHNLCTGIDAAVVSEEPGLAGIRDKE